MAQIVHIDGPYVARIDYRIRTHVAIGGGK